MQGVLAFLVCLSSFSNYECRSFQMEHSFVIYSDSRFGHSLDSVPHSDHLTDNYSKKVVMPITPLLNAYYADFSFPSHPIFELKWSIFLSPVCLQKVYAWPHPGDLNALSLRSPLDEVHPMLSRFQLRSSKSPWPHLGVYSKSHPPPSPHIVSNNCFIRGDIPSYKWFTSIHVSNPWCGHALMVSINLSQHW